MKHLYYYDTPAGKIGLAEEKGLLTNLYFRNMKAPLDARLYESEVLRESYTQLMEYFGGERKEFDIPINPAGDTKLQHVLIGLLGIGYGKTVSYKELGEQLGMHARAVGALVGKNPLPVIIPCHRVIGSDGSLIGYVGGLEAKKFLLELEGC